MKKNIIKITVAIVVFLIAVILSDLIMNKGNSNMTVEMGPATLPVVRIMNGDKILNTMHGYTRQMEGEYLKDSIFCLEQNRNVKIQIEKFDAKISNISFEVRSTDGERLVEDTSIADYQEEQKYIQAEFTIKDLIDVDTEYMLIIIINLEDGKKVRYYTRFIQGTDYHMTEMLNFVEVFHTSTFDKDAAKNITKYLESNAEGDNTTFAHVNIHSSFSQITWGDLKVERVTVPETRIRDITSQFGVIELTYYVRIPEGRETRYYSVVERYRLRYGVERLYLLDFERDMEVIFLPKEAEYAENKISIGIADPSLQVTECEGGNIFAFTQSGRLYSFNLADNKITTLFGFYDEENADIRTMYEDHNIEILGMDETGNVRFMVSGYMNRGSHEGNVGVQVYYYNSMHNTIEEEVFIPYTKSSQLLQMNLEQLSYVNNTNQLFLLLDGTLYDINLLDKSYTEVATGLVSGSYQVSKSNRMIVWQNGDNSNASSQMTLMNLGTKRQTTLEASSSEYMKPLGFMGEDLIYGVARKKDLATDGYGGVLFPMHTVKIEGENGNVLKTYSQDNIYVVDAQITDNQINLNRVKREGINVGDEELNENTISGNEMNIIQYSSEDYEMISDDQIMNTIVEEAGSNKVEVVAIEEYEKIVQIAIKNTIAPKSLKFLTPKEVAYEGVREITLPQSEEIKYYYVHNPYGLYSISENISEAISLANSLSGMVYDENGNYLYRKGVLQQKNQIMKIEAARKNQDRSSLAVCLDTILLAEGVTKNTQNLLQHGDTPYSILQENLENVEVLDLTGCTLEIVLYYVNQDIPVLARLKNGDYVLIIGFNELNTVLMDPSTGTIYKKGMNDSKTMFEAAGNEFLTYVRND